MQVKVRFARAADFVTQYADNLSVGGIFIPDVTDWQPLSEISVEIELPGFQTSTIRARVAHVLTHAKAQELGRPAGTGLEILDKPPGFQEALMRYLALLGKRRDHLVLVADEALRAAVAGSGYHAGPVSLPSARAELDGAGKVLAVVVPSPERPQYARALAGPPSQANLLIGVPDGLDLAVLLIELDKRMQSASQR